MESIGVILSSQPLTVPFGGLITVFVLLVFTGRLKPKQALDEVRQDRDDRVAEAKAAADARIADHQLHYENLIEDKDKQIAQWRTAYMTDEETISALLSHMAELKELSRTGVHLLGALPRTQQEESGT